MSTPAPSDETIAAIHVAGSKRVGHHHARIARVARWLGRPATLYALTLFVIAWVAVNLRPAWRWDEPPFFELQGILGLYAAVVSTIVLTAQNRQLSLDERRSYLELQVNLTSEQKAAKIISLLEELRRDLPLVANRVDHEAEELARAVDPQAMLEAVDRTLEAPVPPSKTTPVP